MKTDTPIKLSVYKSILRPIQYLCVYIMFDKQYPVSCNFEFSYMVMCVGR